VPQRPADVDFATDRGRIASPKRMNEMSDHFLTRLRALEGFRADWDAAVAELKEIGVSRVTEALQPVFDQAQALADELTQMRADMETDAYRDQLIADVIAAIVGQGLFVKAGAGAEGMTLYSGDAAPDPATGNEGDLYAYVEPQ
jgi:hypothetical protein